MVTGPSDTKGQQTRHCNSCWCAWQEPELWPVRTVLATASYPDLN